MRSSETERRAEQEVRDKPAEKGITINNILLTILAVGGAIVGTLVTQDLSDIKETSKKTNASITQMLVHDGKIDERFIRVLEILDNHEKRLVKIEDNGHGTANSHH